MMKSIMKSKLSAFVISFFFLGTPLQAFGQADPVSCNEKTVVASAVRTADDVQAFVQCAYEFVQEVGFAEAYRAFYEDARWRSGPIYVFVSEVTPMSTMARSLVLPPDPEREGVPWGALIDRFGNDYFVELYRIVSNVSAGWLYYSFTNPVTGRDEPKASYVISLDWDGTPAAIGAGVYRRDVPGTCVSAEVNAQQLEEDLSPERLQEFVRCAALEFAEKGAFALSLPTQPRWRSNSIYLFGVDMSGDTLFSGEDGLRVSSELNFSEAHDAVSPAAAFGESFLYYSAPNPFTGQAQRKVTFVKRVVSYGLPLLVGAGYYLDEAVSE